MNEVFVKPLSEAKHHVSPSMDCATNPHTPELFHSKNNLEGVYSKLAESLSLSHIGELMGVIEVERKIASDSEDLQQLVLTDARSILALGHIPDMVYLIFDPPIATNAPSEGGSSGSTVGFVAGYTKL